MNARQDSANTITEWTLPGSFQPPFLHQPHSLEVSHGYEAQEELAVLLQEAVDELRESRKQNAALVEQNKQLVRGWHTNLVQTEAQNVTRASKRQRKVEASFKFM